MKISDIVHQPFIPILPSDDFISSKAIEKGLITLLGEESMQTLSMRTCGDNGLSFELYVDDRRLCEIIGGGKPAFPYWIVEDDLPYFPPHGDADAPTRKERIVCACSCGEYGCGHTHCIVEKEVDVVRFRDFAPEASEAGKKMEFVFSRKNYDEVIGQIVAAAAKRKNEEKG